MILKVFQATVNHYKFLGIDRNIQINMTLVLSYFCLCQSLLTITTFFFVEADTFGEYTDSFYWCVTTLTMITLLSVIIWKKEKLFKLFDSFEKTIENRKYEIIGCVLMSTTDNIY